MPVSLSELRKEYDKSSYENAKGEILKFEGIGNHAVYNPALLKEGNKYYIAARVDSRSSYLINPSTYNSKIVFFENTDSIWHTLKDVPSIESAEDPFFLTIKDGNKNRLLFGFVKTNKDKNPPTLTTKLILSDSVHSISEKQTIAEIKEMKDIRILQLPFGKFLVCGRPLVSNLGRVSMEVVDSLSKINHETVYAAKVLSTELDSSTFLGNNQLFPIRRGIVGTLGHVAKVDQFGNKVYTAAIWTINLETRTMTTPTIIATRQNFPRGGAKDSTLRDVVFPGSLYQTLNGDYKLIAGLSDVSCGSLLLPRNFNKFLE